MITSGRSSRTLLVYQRIEDVWVDVYIDLEISVDNNDELKWRLVVQVLSGLSQDLQRHPSQMETEVWKALVEPCTRAAVIAAHVLKGEAIFQIGPEEYLLQNHRLCSIPKELQT